MTETKYTKHFYNTEIPEGWSDNLLGDLGCFSKGKGILKEQVISEGLPCVRYGEIYTTHDFIIKDFKSFIAEDVAAESKVIKSGDILFAGSGETVEEIGKAVAYIGTKKAYAGGDVIILSTKRDVNPECLSYALETDFVKRQKRVLGQGNSIVHIYSSDLSKIKIPLPPLSEQKAIAQLLSTWDEAIHKTEQLIVQKELRKKWLMQNLLTGKMRLKGFDGEWKKCSAFDFLKQRNEQATNNGNIPLFSLTIENGITEKSDRYEREFLVKDKSIKNYKIVYPNDIVFNPANLRWGAIAKHSRNFKVLLSPIYEVLTVKQGYNIDFISYLVSSPRQISYYASILEGTLIERMAVKVEPFLSTKYEIPPFKEQTAIAEILQASDKEISLLKAKVEKLKEQKKGLMQVLLTGKKRLKA